MYHMALFNNVPVGHYNIIKIKLKAMNELS